MIQLITGPYRSGKTIQVLDDLVTFKNNSPLARAIVVVPSARYRRLLKDRLSQQLFQAGGEPVKGLFNLEIMTFYEVCKLALAAGNCTKTLAPKDLQAYLMLEVLLKLKSSGQLQHLAPIATYKGTASSALALVDEFARAALTPQDVLRKLSRQAAGGSRHIELGRIYNEYWQLLDQLGCFDQKGSAFAAREYLQRGLPALSIDYLLIDGFDRISKLQAQVFAGLAKHARQTVITFDYAGSEHRQHELYAWKESSYRELVQNLSPQELPRQDFSAQSPKSAGEPAAVVVETVAVLDRFAEMQEIVRRCKEAIVRYKTPPGEILVAMRDVSKYRGAIEAAFDQAGIEYHIDTSYPAAGLPVLKFMRGLLRLATDDFPRDLVLSLLASPFMSREPAGITWRLLPALERLALENNVVGSIAQWLAAVDKADATIASDLKERLTKFFERLRPPQATCPLAVHVSWVEDLLDQLLRLPANQARADSLPAQLERESVRALRAALSSLLQQENLLPQGPVPFDDFLKRLESLLDAANYANHQAQSPGVLICPAEAAPNRRFDRIYLAGAVEGEFPRRSRRSGFVNAEELAAWSSYGINLSDPREDPGFEPALLYSIYERSRTHFFVTVPAFEMSGDELTPSFFLSDGTLPVAETETNFAELYARAGEQPVSAAEALAAAWWHNGNCEVPAAVAAQPEAETLMAALSGPLAASLLRSRVGGSVPLAGAFNGDLSELVTSEMLQPELPKFWSATAINSYRQCPFQYWLTHYLRLEPRLEPEAGLTSLVRGVIYHRTLELFYARLKTTGGDEDATREQAMLKDALAQAVAETEAGGDFHPGDYWENEIQDMALRLERFVRAERVRLQDAAVNLVPSMFEAQFGFDDPQSAPALVVQTDCGPALIRGKIDRVDLPADGQMSGTANVIDYKAGSTPISAQKAEQGTHMQLPLYALAVERSILPGSKVASGYYLGVSAAGSIGHIDFSASKHNDLLERTEDFVRQTVHGVASGHFEVAPRDTLTCQTCSHSRICRVSEVSPAGADEL